LSTVSVAWPWRRREGWTGVNEAAGSLYDATMRPSHEVAEEAGSKWD
jgi:hypothetical protein